MHGVRIVLLCILSAVVYGVLHDQVTARVCVEYFTIGHPPIFGTESPTLLALGWGVIATWWSGLLVGIPIALAARVGKWPKYDAAHLVRPLAWLFATMACVSLVAGISGYILANTGYVRLTGGLRNAIPAVKHPAFLADLWAHLAAYAVGFGGGLSICGWVLIERRKLARSPNGSNGRINIRLALSQFKIFDATMSFSYLAVLVAAAVGGVFWHLVSHFFLIHFVTPPVLAVIVAILFRSLSWRQQLVILFVVLAISELVRVITYCVAVEGWRYIFTDGETQLVMLLSFTVQCVVALFVWSIARLLICPEVSSASGQQPAPAAGESIGESGQ